MWRDGRGKRGSGYGEVGGTIIAPSEQQRKRLYAIKQKRIARQLEQIASDKANTEALNQLYRASDKTPALRKRDDTVRIVEPISLNDPIFKKWADYSPYRKKRRKKKSTSK